MLVPAPAENLYQSSVKFLSHFWSPRPKSLRRSESFRILYWLHSEAAKNENVSEYSSIWLYQRQNVLIYYKIWWKLGHWGGGGGGKGGERKFAKRWVHISFRFRVTQNLVPMTFEDNWTLNVLRNIHSIPAPAENLYQSSVKFLSHFWSPRPKSLRRSESFRNLYWLHSETAKIKNVSEYSSMWLYQRRNVLISH